MGLPSNHPLLIGFSITEMCHWDIHCYEIHWGLFSIGNQVLFSNHPLLIIGFSFCQTIHDWIGLREHLQEIIDFPIKYGAFL